MRERRSHICFYIGSLNHRATSSSPRQPKYGLQPKYGFQLYSLVVSELNKFICPYNLLISLDFSEISRLKNNSTN